MLATDNQLVLCEILTDVDQTSALVVVIDPYSLKIKSEMEVVVADQDFSIEDEGYQMDDEYQYYSYSTPPQLKKLCCWNKGKYLISSIFASNSDRCVYFLVYDTETKEIISKIERTGDLKTSTIYSFSPDSSDPKYLFCSMVKNKVAVIGKLNIFSGKIESYSKPFQLNSAIPDYFDYNSESKQVNICFDYQCFTYQVDSPFDYEAKLTRMNTSFKSVSEIIKFFRHQAIQRKLNKEGLACNYGYYKKIVSKMDKLLIANTNSENNIEILTSEGVKFNQFIKDNFFIFINNIIDITQINDSMAAAIIMNSRKFEVILLFTDAERENKAFEIKQITLMAFNYPNIIAVKECTEIFICSITSSKLQCAKLNMPILMECSRERDYSSDNSIYCLVDHGDFIKFCSISTDFGYTRLTLYNRSYEKINFPQESIIDAFGFISFKTEKDQDNGILLQFESCLLKCFTTNYGSFEKLNLKFEKGEIIHNPEVNGLLIWK